MLCLSIALCLVHAPEAEAVDAYGSAMYVDSVSYYYPTGYLTCSGDPYYGYEYTAAASNLYNGGFYPLGTVLGVYNPDNYAYVEVLVNDCTPAAFDGGTFDVSYAAARDIGMLYEGRSYDMVVWTVSN